MKTDFLDAHHRHWEDAELLKKRGRWANADHLYGLSAECGLKRLMQAFGMEIDPGTGSPKEWPDKVHIMGEKGNAWDRYESYRQGRKPAKYPLPVQNPFQDWDISQRYAHRAGFSKEIVKSHRIGAQLVRKLIHRADREGNLS